MFGQPCTHFILAYFCSFNFQLSTNKNVVVVVLLPLIQKVNKWTSYKCCDFQLAMSVDLVKLYTGDRVVKSSKDSSSTL